MTETIGVFIKPTDETKAEKDRINSLIETTERKEIDFYGYTEKDDKYWGYRMEINTNDVHITPNDITLITKNTDWSFTGCRNGSVLFEGQLGE